MTVTRSDQLRQWRWEEFRRRRLEPDAWQDRVFRQRVFLQTVKLGLFAIFGAANGTLFTWYATALPFVKVERISIFRGEMIRSIYQAVQIDPRGALCISIIGCCLALAVFWVESVIEDLVVGRVKRGRVLEDEIGIQTGFFKDIEQTMQSRPKGLVNFPVINQCWRARRALDMVCIRSASLDIRT